MILLIFYLKEFVNRTINLCMEIISIYGYGSKKSPQTCRTAFVDVWQCKTNHHHICGTSLTPFRRFSFQFQPRQHLCASNAKKQWERSSLANSIESGHEFAMLGIGEFAIRMGVCSNTVRNWINDGKLVEGVHYLHIRRVYRFPWSREFVEKLMHTLAPSQPPARPVLRSHRINSPRLKFRA